MGSVAAKSLATLVFGCLVFTLTLLRIDGEAFRETFGGHKKLLQQNPQADWPNAHIHPDPKSEGLYTTSHHPGTDRQATELSPDDVLVIILTSASTIWRRLPIHLTTVLKHSPNFAIYSDFAETVAGVPVLDAFSELAPSLKESEAFSSYRHIQDFHKRVSTRHQEAAGLDGGFHKEAWDTAALSKHKSLSVLRHVNKMHPDFKWYAVIEEDGFLFWHNLLRALTNLSSEDAHWLGSLGHSSGATFVHGGSGVVLSHAALEKVFDNESEFIARGRLGDHVLRHVFEEKNVTVNSDRHFGADPWWLIHFGDDNWDEAVLALHHMHQRDISQLWEFEKELEESDPGRDFTYGDLFKALVMPVLLPEKDSWDCGAREQSSLSMFDMFEDPNLGDATASSKETCRSSCDKNKACLMWKWDESDGCFRDSNVALGAAAGVDDAGNRTTSGWMIDRIRELM